MEDSLQIDTVQTDAYSQGDSLLQSVADTLQLGASASGGDAATEDWVQMVRMMATVMGILIGGMIIWRIMTAASRKNSKSKGTKYFKSKYDDKWRNR